MTRIHAAFIAGALGISMLLPAESVLAKPKRASSKPAPKQEPDAVKYLDALKVCRPFRYEYPHPLVKSFTAANDIKGVKDDHCLVDFVMPGNMVMTCSFSRETVELMTNEQEYANAREGKMETSTAVTARIQSECKVVPRR